MSKYNRLCVSISDETHKNLDLLVTNTNKKIKALNKSAIVELSLNKFLKDATVESVAKELSEQLMVE